MACILLCSSAVSVHDSQAYRKMNVTRERISRILKTKQKKEMGGGGRPQESGHYNISDLISDIIRELKDPVELSPKL